MSRPSLYDSYRSEFEPKVGLADFSRQALAKLAREAETALSQAAAETQARALDVGALRVGWASAPITPPVGTPTYGYGARRGQGVETSADDVFASREIELTDLLSTARATQIAATKSDRTEEGAPYLKEAVGRTEGIEDEKVVHARARLLPDYALVVLKDSDKANAVKLPPYK